MKDIYEIQVLEDTFQNVVEGRCKFVLVVGDKQHQAYKSGNIISIVCGENMIKATIKDLLYFQSVKELVDMIGKERIGFSKSKTTDGIEDAVARIIKPQLIEKYGLIAVGFEEIENS